MLIQGASGTGKELVAQAIHDQSMRLEGPFVRVNCGALPDTLLESELFGHVKGAFTDARRDRPGRFQQAHGGTLFLDEVGDLSPAFQVKLLRALQGGEVQPLGGTETLRVDVRVVSATNHDLGTLIRSGSFREDLYYRLCVVPIQIPPLKDRREDIIPLVEHYIARFATRTGKPIQGVTPAALHSLVDHDYPGNVRELINIIERAFVLCHGRRIDIDHLPPALRSPATAGPEQGDGHSGPMAGDGHSGPMAGDWPLPAAFAEALPRNLKPSERKAISLVAGTSGAEASAGLPAGPARDRPEVRALIELLNAHGWNRAATARALGVSRGTLWRRMKEYALI